MRKILSLSIMVMLLMGWACTNDENENSFVVTEQILHASGDQIRIMGRVISNSQIQVSDHGFYLSLDPSFSSPIIISLGPKEGPGRFIGLAEGLSSNNLYYIKSFMDFGGETLEGNVLEVNTLSTFIEEFSPTFGEGGDEMLITGGNFTEDTRVFFGDQEAQIINIELESKITLSIPPLDGIASVPITILSQDQEISFSRNFEYQTGTYELITTFPDPIKLYDNVFFQTNKEFYVGLGSERRIDFVDYFQKYNPSTGEWNRVNFPGSSRSYAFFTDHYIGGGTAARGINPIVINPSFWKITDSGFTQLEDLPFESRESLAFELGENLFVLGTKQDEDASFRMYDPASSQWSELSAPPQNFDAEDAVFTYGGNAYVIATDRSIWRFQGGTQTWDLVGTYPGSVGQGYGMARVIGNKAYVGLFRRSNELWEMDLETLTWTSKNSMPGLPQSILVGHFEKDGYLYIMRVPDINLTGDYPMDMYKFDPDGI